MLLNLIHNLKIHLNICLFKKNKEYFSNRLSKLVTENFNTFVCLDVKGKQKIQTQFKIDKNGNIVDIKVRAPHIKLEEEAIRVIQTFTSIYSCYTTKQTYSMLFIHLPIIFQVEE